MINPLFRSYKRLAKVYVFKTNIESELDLNIVKSVFNHNPSIIEWSVDMEDIDNVLRVETKKHLSEKDIIDEVTSKGFFCEELE